MGEPFELSLCDAADAIAGGRLSPVELLESTRERIERIEPRVLAWARVCEDEARRDARRLAELAARGERLGALHGVPVGVKDIFYTAGIETA